MKKGKTTYIILITFILIVFFFFIVVIQKERTIKEGELVLLELAPIDPRSLIQGDYMQLNYTISTKERDNFGSTADQVTNEEKYKKKRGYVLLQLDEKQIGHYVKLTDKMEKKENNQIYIRFFNYDGWQYNIGAESYFFQEGEAVKFEKAKYGALRVDDKGNSVLIGVYDKDLKLIE